MVSVAELLLTWTGPKQVHTLFLCVTARCGCAQALGRRGVDVAYVGGSSSVLAVGGSCARGNVAIWDTLAPPAGGPVAALGAHTALVTALQARLHGPQTRPSLYLRS